MEIERRGRRERDGFDRLEPNRLHTKSKQVRAYRNGTYTELREPP